MELILTFLLHFLKFIICFYNYSELLFIDMAAPNFKCQFNNNPVFVSKVAALPFWLDITKIVFFFLGMVIFL